MVQDRLPVRSNTSRLVTRLLQNPGLPVYIANLSNYDLVRLVRFLGKEDAQELLVYATPDQITDLIETETWRSNTPGCEETFEPERFLEWVELWQDMGIEQLTGRLVDLGSQLLALTLNRYVVVVDIYEVGVSGWMETFSRFGVMPKEEERWPQLLELLKEVWSENPEFMEEALAYCCQRRSLTTEKTHIAENENLAPDVAAARDRHRRERGYVTPVSASAFLNRIRETPLADLILERDLDPATAMQLRQRQAGSKQPAVPPSGQENDSVPGRQSEAGHSVRESSDSEVLDELLAPVFSSQGQAHLLLTSGSETESGLYLDQQLRRLGVRNPSAMQSRAMEILFLANVLMEGIGLQGVRMNESEAMRCASHTCNLGLTYCVFEVPWLDEKSMVRELLDHQPGLIRMFDVGFKLLAALRGKVSAGLEAVLRADMTQRRLARDPWLQGNINDALEDLCASSREQEGFRRRLARLLELLEMYGDPTACEQLRIIGDTLPRLPNSLSADRKPGIYLDRSWRFIATRQDLLRLSEFLDNLGNHLFR